MQIFTKRYALELKHTFKISRESRNFQDSLIVILQQDGIQGYGEATTNPYYGITLDNLEESIKALESEINNFQFSENHTPYKFYHQVLLKTSNSFAKCALDLAAYDLFGKLTQQKTYEYLNYSPSNLAISSYTIGLDTVDKMVAKLEEKPWPIYKIKLGVENDLEILGKLRAKTDAIFRIDANCAWDAERTISLAPKLKELGVEFIEQPLPADDMEGHRKVYEKSVLPIIADESCIVASDVAKCKNLFHGINIKLTKCGGITPAISMLAEAKHLGLKTMIGCMTESSVGISGIAQLLPELDFVDMDGALLLSQDIATGVSVTQKGVDFGNVYGNGVTLL